MWSGVVGSTFGSLARTMNMKKILPAVFCLFVTLFFGFSAPPQGSIIGKVNPPQGAGSVLAVMGRDTMRASLSTGNFRFNGLKAGLYQVWIKGISPYRDTLIRNIAVTDTNTTDLGTLRLPR
ncbi:carboxypeptidase regulatory-like domain-containing protein [Pedobacter yulinensis]|uniref:Carboxypeptidase regulatory-like domain-containing protein n=1 Tax=Pedobacter yulinensis TaxID=2126353 RepID=A0A2T3HR76_9SPHI|nr:carboxypeptidase regulatory-like domain-containing protein [Pedobacter yulinensis]